MVSLAPAATKVTFEWPLARLAGTWNKLPIGDLKPVKKFTDRKTAVAPLWAGIQRLTPVPAPQTAHGATSAAKASEASAAGRGRAHDARKQQEGQNPGESARRKDGERCYRVRG